MNILISYFKVILSVKKSNVVQRMSVYVFTGFSTILP